MSEAAEKLMDVDEFLVWAEGREGKWELHDGAAVAMAPEAGVTLARKNLRGCRACCRVPAPGRRLRRLRGGHGGARQRAPRLCAGRLRDLSAPKPPDEIETSNSPHRRRSPLALHRRLRPRRQAGGLFQPALASSIICWSTPTGAWLILHSRGREGVIETRILREGEVRLDPPGLAFDVAELFG